MSGDWLQTSGLDGQLELPVADRLRNLRPASVAKGSVLFRPGDEPNSFVLVLSGRIAVYLTGQNGREILLYSVSPGETCIQTTIGMVGGQAYSGEAIAETDLVVVSIPRSEFARLMDDSASFRRFIFRSFGERLGEVTHLLEKVAFVRIDQRLAAALLEVADSSAMVSATHQELARRIGSAREVVSRKLEAFARQGLVSTDRGQVQIIDAAALHKICEET